MEHAVVTVAEVKAVKTQSGKTRYVLRDTEGGEFTTFREQIARAAAGTEGRRVRIGFHEEQRGQFTNVYLDSIEVLDEDDDAQERREPVEEVAWKTAVDAAPWLVGDEKESVSPDELFERLQPFKQRVADDIREPGNDDES